MVWGTEFIMSEFIKILTPGIIKYRTQKTMDEDIEFRIFCPIFISKNTVCVNWSTEGVYNVASKNDQGRLRFSWNNIILNLGETEIIKKQTRCRKMASKISASLVHWRVDNGITWPKMPKMISYRDFFAMIKNCKEITIQKTKTGKSPEWLIVDDQVTFL